MNKKEQDALAAGEKAWKDGSRRPYSLWDMIHFIANKTITVIRGIDHKTRRRPLGEVALCEAIWRSSRSRSWTTPP